MIHTLLFYKPLHPHILGPPLPQEKKTNKQTKGNKININ